MIWILTGMACSFMWLLAGFVFTAEFESGIGHNLVPIMRLLFILGGIATMIIVIVIAVVNYIKDGI